MIASMIVWGGDSSRNVQCEYLSQHLGSGNEKDVEHIFQQAHGISKNLIMSTREISILKRPLKAPSFREQHMGGSIYKENFKFIWTTLAR